VVLTRVAARFGLGEVLDSRRVTEGVTAAQTAADFERYARSATERSAPDDFDRYAGPEILRRLDLLHSAAGRRPADGPPPDPIGWTHGDLHSLNMLYTGETPTAILDWDRLGPRPLAYEVVRTASITFDTLGPTGIDLDRMAAFARGYRTRITLSDEALADAARRRWWNLICSTWPLQRHYDAGDPGIDHLFVRIGRVADWWTAHFDEVLAALR
jgi:homoserine kinase type II